MDYFTRIQYWSSCNHFDVVRLAFKCDAIRVITQRNAVQDHSSFKITDFGTSRRSCATYYQRKILPYSRFRIIVDYWSPFAVDGVPLFHRNQTKLKSMKVSVNKLEKSIYRIFQCLEPRRNGDGQTDRQTDRTALSN